jgi:hypothetical protein
MAFSLYLLVDPSNGSIRYVGKTIQNPKDRLRRHIRDAQCRLGDMWEDHTHRANWIRKVLDSGSTPGLEVLGAYRSLSELNAAERFFIHHIRSVVDLTNATVGGDGGNGRKPVIGDDVVLAEFRAGLGSGAIAKRHHTCKKRVLSVLKRAGYVKVPGSKRLVLRETV